MRKLKFHEQKLLKKVDFLQWKREHGHRELQVRRWLSQSCAIKSSELFPLLIWMLIVIVLFSGRPQVPHS
jgi:hypothetical protein